MGTAEQTLIVLAVMAGFFVSGIIPFASSFFVCCEEEGLGRTSRERWGGGNVGRVWREHRMS